MLLQRFTVLRCRCTSAKFGIMKDLHEAGLRGRLPCFIEGFLKNRQFSVCLGVCLSGLFDQKMGVPQGNVPQ